MVDIGVNVSPDGSNAVLSLVSFLGSRFARYREIVSRCGATYNPGSRTNSVTLANVARVIGDLSAGGFTLAVDPQLTAQLQAEAASARALANAGAERASAAESSLANRGLCLFPYQRHGVRWLAPRRQALLADEMGLGKTVQALIALPERAAALVVAPAAVAANWVAEARRWRPDLRAESAPRFRWPRAGEIVVITYGRMPGNLVDGQRGKVVEDGSIPTPVDAPIIIADEAHALKNGKAMRTKRFRALRDAALAAEGRVWLITGTPLLNRLSELWAVLEAAGVARDAFGSWQRFGALSHEQIAENLATVSLHRRRLEVLPELPKKMRQTQFVEIDTATRQLCDELVDRLRAAGIDLAAIQSAEELASVTRGEIVFELISKVRAALASAKIPAVLDAVEGYEDQGLPVVVFCAHVEPLRRLAARDGWALIDGSVSADDRAKIVQRFQAGELRGIALSYAAGGVGVTLTRSSHMVHVDLPWTPALLQQAEDRICRIGASGSACHYLRLVASHAIEERVIELLDEKMSIIEATVEASAVSGDTEAPAIDERLAHAAELAARQVETSIVEIDALRAAQEAERAAARDARKSGGFEVRTEPTTDRFRPAKDEVELHAARAAVTLSNLDPDHANQKNGVGWNGGDGEFGHSITGQLVDRGTLTDGQWIALCRMVRKYHRQVGKAPESAVAG